MNQQVLIVLPKIILTVHDGILDFKDNTAILQATKSSRGFLLCGLITARDQVTPQDGGKRSLPSLSLFLLYDLSTK